MKKHLFECRDCGAVQLGRSSACEECGALNLAPARDDADEPWLGECSLELIELYELPDNYRLSLDQVRERLLWDRGVE